MADVQTNGAAPSTAKSSPTILDSPSSYSTFIDAHDAFLFDCDGVIWNGDEVIPGVVETLKYLRKLGKKVHFHRGVQKTTAERWGEDRSSM